MEEKINIYDLKKVGAYRYDVYFSSNFDLTILYYQFSPDLINWSEPILINGIDSPKRITINTEKNFHLKIYNNSIPLRKHNTKFNTKYN